MNQPLGLEHLAVLASAKHPEASGRELARMAQEAGYELTSTTLNAIRHGSYKYSPRPETVRALAWLANVDEETALTSVFPKRIQPPEVSDLSSLVNLAIHKHRTSGRQLAFMAQGHGFRITTTTINHLKAGTYKSAPNEETIRAIAWLAGVSDEVAFTAAGQPVPGPPFAEELPPGVDNLSPKARKAVLDMLRVLVDLEKNADASNTDSQDQPTDIRDARERRHTRAGQKTGPSGEPETVVPLSDDAIDRLHKEQWETLAAKKAPGGITHDQNPEDT